MKKGIGPNNAHGKLLKLLDDKNIGRFMIQIGSTVRYSILIQANVNKCKY